VIVPVVPTCGHFTVIGKTGPDKKEAYPARYGAETVVPTELLATM
jgi:hypothetical protein